MKHKIIVVLCAVLTVGGFNYWVTVNPSDPQNERTYFPSVEQASPILKEVAGAESTPGKSADQKIFVVADQFKREGRRWTPLDASLTLGADIQEGLQLTAAELHGLSEAISFLLTKSGEIQAEDAYVASDEAGNPVGNGSEFI